MVSKERYWKKNYNCFTECLIITLRPQVDSIERSIVHMSSLSLVFSPPYVRSCDWLKGDRDQLIITVSDRCQSYDR